MPFPTWADRGGIPSGLCNLLKSSLHLHRIKPETPTKFILIYPPFMLVEGVMGVLKEYKDQFAGFRPVSCFLRPATYDPKSCHIVIGLVEGEWKPPYMPKGKTRRAKIDWFGNDLVGGPTPRYLKFWSDGVLMLEPIGEYDVVEGEEVPTAGVIMIHVKSSYGAVEAVLSRPE